MKALHCLSPEMSDRFVYPKGRLLSHRPEYGGKNTNTHHSPIRPVSPRDHFDQLVVFQYFVVHCWSFSLLVMG
jgi:hypothetical protein